MAERFSTGHANMVCEAVKTAYANGVLAIFGGASQPADCNSAETGTLLCLVTLNSGAFTPGVATNGLEFGTVADGALPKASGETWSGTVLAAASTGTTATWFRFYDNTYTTGASTTAKRFDGAISTSSAAELPMANPVLVSGAPLVISSFTVTLPRS